MLYNLLSILVKIVIVLIKVLISHLG